MATGIYNTVIGASVNPSDVDIIYHFTPSLTQQGDTSWTKLDATQILTKINDPDNTSTVNLSLNGAYTLKLDATTFSQTGFYTILIKPKEIHTIIQDCGYLSSDSSIRGIILDSADPNIGSNDIQKFQNNGLIGYTVSYIDVNNTSEQRIPNFITIITSNNKVESINSNLTTTSQKAISYRLNNASSLVFCTLTPSSSSSSSSNNFPFLGQSGMPIILSNPFFTPVMLEVELTDWDIEGLANIVAGNMSKSIDSGTLTYYTLDGQNNIFRQYQMFEIKDQFTGKSTYEGRALKSTLDQSSTWTTVIPNNTIF